LAADFAEIGGAWTGSPGASAADRRTLFGAAAPADVAAVLVSAAVRTVDAVSADRTARASGPAAVTVGPAISAGLAGTVASLRAAGLPLLPAGDPDFASALRAAVGHSAITSPI
jgi:hypothetical protein